jgi:uncharacterized protein YbjT (DUF2867 family)
VAAKDIEFFILDGCAMLRTVETGVHVVAGATGFLGSEICSRLIEQGHRVRALVRASSDAERVEALRALGAEVVEADLKEPETLAPACVGASVVLSGATAIRTARDGDTFASVDRDGNLALVAAARDAGASRFVFVAFPEFGPESPLTRAKRDVEQGLSASGLDSTVVQPGVFHESWLGAAVGFDAAAGTLSIAGSGAAANGWVSLTDVAAAAAAAAEAAEAVNATIPLASERLSYNEIIAIFEEETGRTFEVTRVPEEELEAQRRGAANEWEESFAGLALAVAHGAVSPSTDRLPALGVKTPRTVRDYARQFAT